MEVNRVKNICWKCTRWQECFKLRYSNQKQEYMKQIETQKGELGESIIYVGKCEKFEYEDQRVPIEGLCQLDFEELTPYDMMRIKRELSKRDSGEEIR